MRRVTLIDYGFVIIVFLLLSLTGWTQQRSISGVVQESENNAPLEGTIVSIGNPKVSTVTDRNGRFSISVPANRVSPFVSFPDYETKTETIAAQEKNIIVVVNKSTVNRLNDVAIVGNSTQKRSDLTGSISSIKGKELLNTDGAPEGNTTIRIWGINPINGGNSLLIVIDGFQGSDLNCLNPNDIASVEILKDASAKLF